MAKNITIQIASDFVCPWCLIGHVRLEKALEQTGLKDRVTIEWLPYELNPKAPTEGLDRKAHLEAKFGGPEKLAELDAKMKDIGAKDNIEFRQDLINKTPNTFKAHRLNWYVAQKHPDKASTMAHRILEAYFTEGKDTGDTQTLAKLAEDIGLDQKEISDFLNSDVGVKEVRALEEEVRAQGISMVPNFTIGDQTIKGAYAPEVYAEALKNALKKAA